MLTGCAANTKEAAAPAAAANKEQSLQEVTLLSPKAPSLIPALLAETKQDSGISLKVETWDTIEQLLARVQSPDALFIAAPLNVGANMAAKGLPLQLIHVNTWGSMYLVTMDPGTASLADLANETVHIPGQSGPPEIITKFVLKENSLDAKVKLAYGTVPDIVQQLAAGTIKHAVLPEPVLSGLRLQQQGRVKEVADFQQVWRTMYGQDLPQTGIFVNRKWAQAHPNEIARFQELYRSALQETVRQPDAALKQAAGAFGIPEAVLAEAMPKISLIFKDAREARPEVERYFNILLQAAPDSIGGALPDDGFYYGS
ncbi:ABC transporter substrate-binding protein [Paenibacillus sp. y28]|uniref:ABC transporter substrate-binding protein n=1 Tax=Paenibacillus sp. y28 TaxID=3129110 RepID=UPI003019A9EA